MVGSTLVILATALLLAMAFVRGSADDDDGAAAVGRAPLVPPARTARLAAAVRTGSDLPRVPEMQERNARVVLGSAAPAKGVVR